MTIIITVRLFAMYRDYVGEKSISLEIPEETAVWEALEVLEESYLKQSQQLVINNSETKSSVTILLNGKLISNSDRFHSTLSDADVLSIMPAVTGGSTANGNNTL